VTVRLLDVAAGGLVLVAVALILTGGVAVGTVALTRPEDAVVALAGVVGIRLLLRPVALPALSPARVVAIGVLVYALGMSFIVLTRHRALRTHALDLGQYLQIIWNLADGQGAWTTLPRVHAWGEHFSPIFYLLAPLQWVAPGAAILLAAQTLILAAGAPAIFGYAARRLDPRAAAAFAVLYLVNPSLHGINLRDIHPAAFVIALVPWAALAFETGRYGWCAVALLAVLACREDAAVAVLGFGVWVAVARRRWWLGGLVAVASVLVLAVEIRYLMPYFRGEPYPHLHRYAHLGSGLGEILVTLAAAPWRWLLVIVSAQKLVYVLTLLAPLGFLPLWGGGALLAALPGLAMNLLSLDPVLVHHRSQYQAFVLPFLALAAVDGYARLRARRRDRPLLGRAPAAAALVVGVLASVVLTARTVNDLSVARWRLGPDQRAAHALMARVPPRVAVSANERLVPHLATRPEIYIFPGPTDRSAFVLARDTDLARQPLAGWAETGRAGAWRLLERPP
jgi:uncharacterized membrane protein